MIIARSIEEYGFDGQVDQQFENQVLYEMCRRHPDHRNVWATRGKIISIGRIYAASPERGAGQVTRTDGSEFLQSLAIAISNSAIDKRLDEIDFLSTPTDEKTMSNVISLHSEFVELIWEVTRVWKSASTNETVRRQRSFASKYLHFHRPNAFPIMDSFVRKAISNAGYAGGGGRYPAFCKGVVEYARNEKTKQSLREIDTKLVLAGRSLG